MCADTTGRFESILYPQVRAERSAQTEDALHDLALDQVFSRLDGDAPRASSAFRVLLRTAAEVEYRKAVFRGLERPPLRSAVEKFLHGMAQCDRRDRRAADFHYPYEAELWHLSALVEYVGAVESFHADLAETLPAPGVTSAGWERLGRHVEQYHSSPVFVGLASEAIGLQDQLSRLRYNALIRGGKITIAPIDDEADLGEAVLTTFERFRQGETADHRTAFRPPGLDHVQGWMLERAALVHPKPFAHLVRCAGERGDYRDRMLARDRRGCNRSRSRREQVLPRQWGLPR